jgi:hypothetical protein
VPWWDSSSRLLCRCRLRTYSNCCDGLGVALPIWVKQARLPDFEEGETLAGGCQNLAQRDRPLVARVPSVLSSHEFRPLVL